MIIKNLINKYEDNSAMVPLTKLDYKILRKLFYQVVEAITPVGVEPVASLLDGYTAKQKIIYSRAM
uniref:Uncharacterized protein n=1 Tax=Lepeophtheirus salmonis TaxID=72036 RepID=A0A0K2U6K1_LEPSM